MRAFLLQRRINLLTQDSVTSSMVENLSAVAGATVTAALNTLNTAIGSLTSTSIANASAVAGATVTAALNVLNTAVGTLQTNTAVVWVTGYLPNVQSINPVFVPAPVSGTLTTLRICVSANPGAVTQISTSIGGVAVVNGLVVVGAAEGNGTVKSVTPTANNAVTVGTSSVRIESDGASAVATPAIILLGFTRS